MGGLALANIGLRSDYNLGSYPFMDNSPTRYEALLLCVKRAGSISQLGRDLEIPQSTMSRIVNSSKQLPAEDGKVILAEQLYGVSRHDLRPDIYPRETMVDAHVGQRFQGVDRHAGSPLVRTNASTRRPGAPSCEASRKHFTRVGAA